MRAMPQWQKRTMQFLLALVMCDLSNNQHVQWNGRAREESMGTACELVSMSSYIALARGVAFLGNVTSVQRKGKGRVTITMAPARLVGFFPLFDACRAE